MLARAAAAFALCLSFAFAASAKPGTNACESRPCGPNATCLQVGPGKHACQCQKGFVSLGDNKNCKPEQCPAGHVKHNGKCQAVNACAQKNACGQNAHCTQVGPGQKACECNKGFKGDGKSCKKG